MGFVHLSDKTNQSNGEWVNRIFPDLADKSIILIRVFWAIIAAAMFQSSGAAAVWSRLSLAHSRGTRPITPALHQEMVLSRK